MINMKNNTLLQEIHLAKHHSQSTRNVYQTAVEKYCEYYEMSLEELLQEAETEERDNIDWKYRTLKRRLITFRSYLVETYPKRTVETYFNTIIAVYDYFEISIGKLPRIEERSYIKTPPINYKDLPDKEIIRAALDIANPLMKAIILFMTSSGCARTETLNITIGDYMDSVKEYVESDNLTEIIETLNQIEDVVPTFNILRVKTKKYYTTYCSPEAVTSINSYLLSRTDNLTKDSPLFKTNAVYLLYRFQEINDELNLGKIGKYRRFRSHMMRKFHASALYNDGMSIDKVNDLQGKSKTLTDQAYFMVNPDDLKLEYIEHLPCLLMGKEVEKLSIKSPEYYKLEMELQEKDKQLDELTDIKNRLKALEDNRPSWSDIVKGSE